MRTHWNFSAASEVLFGRASSQQIGTALASLGFRTAFIVTDGILKTTGLIDPIRVRLLEAGIAVSVFEGGVPEPSTDICTAAITAAQSAFGTPDCVIGIGGGSNMDVSKCCAAVLAHGGAPADYFGENLVPGPVIPVIAVPTTAGTGSETTPIAVIEDTSRHLKLAISSFHLLPRLAIVDPLLTLSCPARVTAESGMDALTHAIESYTILDHSALPVPASQRLSFPGNNPLSATLAARAIQLAAENLRDAVYQPHNIGAREGMSLAALLAGMAFANSGLSSVHALQYPLGALTHTSHGLGNAILLPAVVEFLLPSNFSFFAEIAGWLGESVSGLSTTSAAQSCVSALQKLKADIGIPRGLSDIGIKESDIPAMAETAMTYQRLVRCSPRPLDVAAMTWILRRAM